jgi:hypothetical protein
VSKKPCAHGHELKEVTGLYQCTCCGKAFVRLAEEKAYRRARFGRSKWRGGKK